MKISAIKCYPTWVGHRNQLIIKVETDEGIYGWGESGLSGREKAVVGAIEHYREFLIGKDAFNIAAIWQSCLRGIFVPSFLRLCDEANPPKSQPQIWAIGADGGQIVNRHRRLTPALTGATH